jgi:anti-sigma regulatory factor (Ser/Thr protein kinase)
MWSLFPLLSRTLPAKIRARHPIARRDGSMIMPCPPAVLPTETHAPDVERWRFQGDLELGPMPTTVPTARLWSRVILAEWRLPDLADSVELIVSELITNAVAASRPDMSPVRLFIASNGRQVAVFVADARPESPVRMDPDDATEGGRGLLLVSAVSASWGWYPLARGKVVWSLCETT